MVEGAERSGEVDYSGHRYELIDRTGLRRAPSSYETLAEEIRDGSLFRNDLLVKDDGPQLQIGEYPEFAAVFAEFMSPDTHAPDGTALRGTPAVVGPLEPFEVCRLFARLWRERRTGRLFARNAADAEWMVAFREGRPINATSNLTEEAIGSLLKAQGLIDDSAFEEAVEFRRTGGGRIGSALVNLQKVSKRDLNRSLAVQAMDRLMAVFRQSEGTFRFIPDPKAANDEMRLLASTRDVIETGLAVAVDPREITAQLKAMGDPVLMVSLTDELAEGLSDEDKGLLEVLDGGHRLSKVMPQVAHSVELTIAEARTRVLALIQYGVVGVADAKYRELEATLQRLQGLNFFRALDVRRADQAPAIENAFQARLGEYGGVEADDDSEMVRTLRGRIRATLERARDTLLDDDERALYERAAQLGLDHEQPEVRERLRHELLVSKGKAALARGANEDAYEALRQAVELSPDQPEVLVQLGWAQFLSSERTAEDTREAIRLFERAIELRGEHDEAYLYMGKVQRLAGLKSEAEAALRKALQLNPNNAQATSELNLLFRRELDSGKSAVSIEISLGGIGKVAVLCALAFIGLYAGAMHVPGGLKIWPDPGMEFSTANVESSMRETSAMVQIRMNYTEAQLIDAAKALDAKPEQAKNKSAALKYLAKYEINDIIKTLATSRRVPTDQQVIGNQEYYFAPEDPFFWARRGALLLLGLIGFLLVRRDREPFKVVGKPGYVILGLVYGAGIGLLAPAWQVAVPEAATLSGMAAMHVAAEQIFFCWFVGLTLLKAFEEVPLAGVGLTALTYGLYQLTFFAVLQGDVVTILQDVGRLGLFAGGAWGLLLWRSKGILAPMLAHAAMYGVMIISATSAG